MYGGVCQTILSDFFTQNFKTYISLQAVERKTVWECG